MQRLLKSDAYHSYDPKREENLERSEAYLAYENNVGEELVKNKVVRNEVFSYSRREMEELVKE